jgi:hypothetical protein
LPIHAPFTTTIDIQISYFSDVFNNPTGWLDEAKTGFIGNKKAPESRSNPQGPIGEALWRTCENHNVH